MVAKKVVAQLLKEFSLPFAGAMVWAFFGTGDEPLTLPGWIARFSTAFFFLSWLGGQLFRISKQVRTESSLTGIRARIDHVVTQLETTAKQVAGWASGGDSFVFLSPIMNDAATASELPIVAISQGDYPVFSVSARITDIERMPTGEGLSLADYRRIEQNIRLNEISPNSAVMPGASFPVGSHSIHSLRSFNIFFSGRNGRWTQQIRFSHDGQRWWFATRVFRGDSADQRTILHEQVQEGYPHPESLSWA